MAYFEELPNISYLSLLPQSNKIEDRIEVKNIFRRSKLRSDVDNITPPLGVALPVKFVFPAEIVSEILQV